MHEYHVDLARVAAPGSKRETEFMIRMVTKLQARWRARHDLRRGRAIMQARRNDLKQVLADHVVRA